MPDEKTLSEIKKNWHNASDIVLNTAIQEIKEYPPEIQLIIKDEHESRKQIEVIKEPTKIRLLKQIKIAGILFLLFIVLTLSYALCDELVESPYDSLIKILIVMIFCSLIFKYIRKGD